jgi:hypothetical protein
LKKKNIVIMGGELRAQRVHYVKGENVFISPCLKGRGPFIAVRRLDNYKLFISISTKGFT